MLSTHRGCGLGNPGDSGVHAVDLHNGRWSCSCAAYAVRRDCSHLAAVMLVTTPEREASR
jgi:hypothetical protein